MITGNAYEKVDSMEGLSIEKSPKNHLGCCYTNLIPTHTHKKRQLYSSKKLIHKIRTNNFKTRQASRINKAPRRRSCSVNFMASRLIFSSRSTMVEAEDDSLAWRSSSVETIYLTVGGKLNVSISTSALFIFF